MTMNNSNLASIVYFDKHARKHYMKCGGFSQKACGKQRYIPEDITTQYEGIECLTSAGWKYKDKVLPKVINGKVSRYERWLCPKCSNTDKGVSLDQQPSEIGREAKLAVLDLIRDYYDKRAKAYKSGESDKSISDVSGMSEPAVKAIRLEWFGELVDPDPFEVYNNKLETLKEEINVMINDLRDEMKESLK
tara:strand:+ start:2868 stop:3440 length:573 start_codon:yes stop_codon:yes gene_type:complete